MKRLIVSLSLLLLCCSFANTAQAVSTEGAMYYNEGNHYYSEGEYSKALESFKNAVESDPDFLDAYFNLGLLYDNFKKYNEAIECFNKVVQLEPGNSENVLMLAELYYKAGNQQKAMSVVSKIPASDYRYSQAESLKAKIAKAQQNYANKTAITTSNKADQSKKTTLAKLSGPTGMAVDSKGVLYIASFAEPAIYKILPNGQGYLFLKSEELGGPIGLAVDKFDNLYVANYSKNNILKVNPSGEVFKFMENIVNPYYLIINGNNMYITEQGSNTIVKYKLY